MTETLAQLRGKPHLSASSIGDFLDCSLLYKFRKIDQLPPEMGTCAALVFGSVMHVVLAEKYMQKMIGNKISLLKELQKFFVKCWKNEAKDREDIEYKEGEDFKSLLEKGKDLLSAYYEKLPDDDYKVLAIEEPFSFSIPGGLTIPIIGAMDLIEMDDAGTLIITDWKTSSKAYSTDQIDKSLQLTIYQMAMRANGYRDKEILLKFDTFIKTKTPKFEQYYTTRSKDDERKAATRIKKVWEAINKGVFIPRENWKCAGCGYSEYCEQFLLGDLDD